MVMRDAQVAERPRAGARGFFVGGRRFARGGDPTRFSSARRSKPLRKLLVVTESKPNSFSRRINWL
jgi:hypothetical protein